MGIYNMFEENEKSLSETLFSAMKAKNISIEKLAQITGISDRFLELLLEERFDKLPSSPYLHGYIIKISETLGLEGEKIWQNFFKHTNYVKRSGAKDTLPGNRFASSFRINKSVIIAIIIGGIVLVYALIQVLSFFKNPELSLDGIKDDMIVTTSTLQLRGSIDPKDSVVLNGEQLYPDDRGSFEKEIQLAPGFNTLKFDIKKFLGKEYTIEKRIFFEAPLSPENIIERKNQPPKSVPENTDSEVIQNEL